MIVPQPSEDHRSPAMGGGHDPWSVPAQPPPERARPQWGREIRTALLVALPVAVLAGLALGALWPLLAPRVPVVSNGRAVMLQNSEGQQSIAIDGTFLLTGLAVGAVAGALVFWLRRRKGGIAEVLGLAAGALAGAFLAWRVGIWLGPEQDLVAHARRVGEGVIFDGPLKLEAKGVLVGLPFGAVGAHLLCTALWGPRDPLPAPGRTVPQWPSKPSKPSA
ncbi:hypothetical protein SUDANB171_04519 [Streptomyces sp. enrichment culture]|uniref:ABC transporter permease n=1 Tax=Streptomyces sp. enrichment culture TaxID=1795815 RepID=UPI003F5549E3